MGPRHRSHLGRRRVARAAGRGDRRVGLALLVAGQALAFGSWPALVIVLSGIVPTFAWRARAGEKLLSRTFGARYAAYRERSKMIIPYLL